VGQRTVKHLLLLALLTLPAFSSAQSRSFSSADVADAAEQVTGRRSHMGSGVRLLAGETIYGPAQTIRLVKDDKATAETAAAAIKFFEEAPAGSVIVAVMEGEKDFALIGASFVTLAKARHLAGFVIDGSVRDTAQLHTIALPVFARGPVPGSAGGHFRVAGINVPIQCAGVEVRPGDIVAGDSDGVAVVPHERLDQVLQTAQEMHRDEDLLLPLIAKFGSIRPAMQALAAAKKAN
jgi:4-hydroxy-4-methyl-2-oxoglutarate aldolase